jgi:nicotinamidase-related amidase
MEIQMEKGLLIIDVQNDYFKGGNMELVGMENASENCRHLLNSFRENNAPIFHIQHIATRKGSTFFLKNTRGSEIHENVKPKKQEVVVVKHFPNAFRGTKLHDILQDSGVNEMVVCGAMTHMCIDTTVRAAFDLCYTCNVISDACATRDLEFDGRIVKASEVQAAFMASLSIPFANVVTTKEFLGKEYDGQGCNTKKLN